ncbi:MAG TPA: hypothetical protein VF093_03720, partial [Solirubrobacterales bacterium]
MALPASRPLPAWLDRLRSRWWALVPALSIIVVVGGIELYSDSATALTYLALVAVPPLAAYALAYLVRVRENPSSTRVFADSMLAGYGRLAAISITAGLFAFAWLSTGSLVGEAAALALSALACVTLGWLLVCAVPARWLRWGVYAMAAIDAWLVSAELLQGPNSVLSAAAPAADLPALQVANFGAARMGFGDLFVAAALGALLASDRRLQLRGAALAAVICPAFDLLFFFVDQTPATV